jgi:superfamily II DNA/RNA helicase
MKRHPQVLANIEQAGYIHPSKIQSRAIPRIFEGYDLKAQAVTGSGEFL